MKWPPPSQSPMKRASQPYWHRSVKSPMYPAPRASTRPSTTPPSIAPGMLPMPPRTAVAVTDEAGEPAVLAQVGEVADVSRAESLHQAEHYAAQHRAGNVADAAEDRRAERLQAEDRAHGVLGDAVVGAEQDAGNRTEGRPDDEGARDHAVDVDSHKARDLLVLRGRAHRRAQAGAVHEGRERRHHREAGADDGDLHVGDRGAADRIARHLDDLRERENVAAPDEHREVLQDDRDPDRCDERREPRRAPQRPVGEPLP